MTNIRLDIEYDGTGFAGWARQPGLPSIEGALEDALGRILQQDISLSVAGRTDAGVHARGQVASFHIEPRFEQSSGNGPGQRADPAPDMGKLRRSANQLLPAGVVITRAAPASPDFDARYGAVSRTYAYQVLNRAYPSPFRGRYVNYFPGKLDQGLLNEAASLIRGRHDFTAFTPTVTEHTDFERDVKISEWNREGDLLVYRISASGFLRSMVRVLVGTMLEIGRAYRPLSGLPALLAGAGRPAAGETAPAQGLFLESVEYAVE
ncbi:MAG: tRNA pseudouridine(38-40) synthase TruA [Actinobacteria bacterium]|nr:tRNA pseudouridine(38-40) synthase TruA [Actinomycetota bacterium]